MSEQPTPRSGKRKQRRDVFASEESKIRYEAYSRLQTTAAAFGETVPVPEIVAIGGQSDGKSSLLEAFLGFRFNVREVEMGTRRPLIVQMVHDATAESPVCRLQNEDNADYGPKLPESDVAETLKRRTTEHLASIGNVAVSNKAICMRVEYAFCPNLTIIDTPGLILKAKTGENDGSPEAIHSMVKDYITAPHRLILFLQQSSVEWASSLWLHVVQEVDPTFSRTVMVVTKFDNRLREFKESWEVDKFLSATGYLPVKVKPFFIALPADRAPCTADSWRRQIHDVDASTLDFLHNQIAGGFDEQTFGSRVGFGNLRRFLELELARRYREAAPATLAVLQQRCDAIQAELALHTKHLSSLTDAAALRRVAMEYAGEVITEVSALLRGSSLLDPALFGMTSEQEHSYLGLTAWPGIAGPVRPPNASLKLYGGAAFERTLHEFQKAAGQLDVPRIARDKVANVLLANRSISTGHMGDQVAQQIVQGMASSMLLPLLDAASARLARMLRHVFEVAKQYLNSRGDGPGDVLQPYVSFHAALQRAYSSFIQQLEEMARLHLRRQLEANTSQFTLANLMSRIESADFDVADYSLGVSLRNQLDLEPEGAADAEGMDSEAQDGEQEPPGSPHAGIAAVHGDENTLAPRDTSAVAVPARAGGIAAYVDGSPSKGRVRKALRPGRGAVSGCALGSGASTPIAGNPLFTRQRDELLDSVMDKALKLFTVIRQAVVCDLAPSALKNAFLDPLQSSLFNEVFLSLFACSDKQFMTMFHAESAVHSLTQKTEQMKRRADGLTSCKNEFAELARCL